MTRAQAFQAALKEADLWGWVYQDDGMWLFRDWRGGCYFYLGGGNHPWALRVHVTEAEMVALTGDNARETLRAAMDRVPFIKRAP